jgi:integrase
MHHRRQGTHHHRAQPRKTCGSLLAALDVHPRFAMQILRHSKIAVTMEIYTEVPSAATRDALGKLAQWLDPDS